MSRTSLKEKLHSYLWFSLINILLLSLISTRYLAYLPELPTALLSGGFVFTAIISQMALLAFIATLLTLFTLLLPQKIRQVIQASIATVGITALFIDTLVFAIYKFHINAVLFKLVMSGQVASFPLEAWITVLTGISLLFIGQLALIRWLDNKPGIRQIKLGRKLATVIVFTFFTTHGIHVWAAANVYQPVTMFKRYLPLFYPATANSFMEKNGWIDRDALNLQKSMAIKTRSDLNYPLKPLQTSAVEDPVNIVVIVIDSWRADTFSADITPNMWRFAQDNDAAIYDHHMSTGNSTRAGIFGLLGGLPGTYWHAFKANLTPSIFIQRLQEMDYELGIFAGARLNDPAFNQTIFASIPDLRIGSTGNAPHELDENLTEDWINWNQNRDKNKPHFSFLFYDSVHGFDYSEEYEHRFEPMWPEINHLKLNNDTDPNLVFNLYKTSVHYTDSLIERVISQIKNSPDFDNTLVVITSDHGEEMNDNQLNFWGHNGNFTDAQVKVPFIVFGPKFNSNSAKWQSTTMTSHMDLVPTLMKNYLGVSNILADYTLGVDLLDKQVSREWLLSSKYSGYAIISPDSILEVNGTGSYQLLDKRNRTIEDGEINYKHLQEALENISRYN